MKTPSPFSGERLQLISQILGISRSQYVDVLAQIPRRTRSAVGAGGKLAGPPAGKHQPTKATRKSAF
jgi:hypothetical protein